MKNAKLLSKAEMKNVVGAGPCSGQWYNSSDYGVCFNCCLSRDSDGYEGCSNLCERNEA